MYAYCLNNPVMYSDPSGELAFPGEIHNEVVEEIAEKYGLHKEQKINYSSPLYGRADLISDDGQVWDVKRDKSYQIRQGEKQVKKYVANEWNNNKKTKLSVGGSLIESGEFFYESGSITYKVSYRNAGNGVIAYDYYIYDVDEKEVAKKVTTVAAGGTVLFLAYLVFGVPGAAAAGGLVFA